jgi:putative transposase
MKQEYTEIGIEKLCKLFGKTRHAYYDHQWRLHDDFLKEDLILQIVAEIRKSLPRLGTRKLQYLINQQLTEHGLTAGRDYLFDLMAAHKLAIRSRRRKVITTNSKHWMRKYDNLIKDLEVQKPELLWVSDITFVRTNNGFAYLSLITDAYSKKVVGYHVSRNLTVEGCLKALETALLNRCYPDHLLIITLIAAPNIAVKTMLIYLLQIALQLV